LAGRRIITDIETLYYQVPLAEALSDAKHGVHTHFELIVVRMTLADHTVGLGYTYTGGKGGRAIRDLIEYDLKPGLLGQDAGCLEKLWYDMNWSIHYVGRGGIASFAISAIDIALWDARGKQTREPLWTLAGGACGSTKAYAGAIDLHFPMDKLLSNIQHYMDKGFHAVKIKLGQPTLDEDMERVAAVRKLIGEKTVFMVDANMGWTVETAIKAARWLKDYNILWLEEPTIPDDYNGYKRISAEGGLALAAGENYHTIYEFKSLFDSGAVDFPQPDVSNIGGITGWLKVANLATAYNLPVCTHGMQELHVSLMSAMPHASYLEVHSFPIDQYTTSPLQLKDGRAVAPDTSGHGVEFDWEKLRPYQVVV
jgi:L-alanine-DL-glutamate epimerase-like enolase superfamily enzyme